MSKFKMAILFFIIYTACTPNKNKKEMASKNECVKDGNSSFNINIRDSSGKSTVLFANYDAIVIARDEKPFSLVAGSNFKLSELPVALSNIVPCISTILLKSELTRRKVKEPKPTPDWLLKFTAADFLSLNDVKILSPETLNLSKLKYLVLIDVSFEDRAAFTKGFHIFKSLKYLVHNDIFSSSEIALIKETSPNIKVMSEYEFNKKVGDGDIVID